MKKIKLIICALVLGTFALQAAPPATPLCRNVTNTLNCPIQICVGYSIICPGGPPPVSNVMCSTIPASSTGTVCVPILGSISFPPCVLTIASVSVTNLTTSESILLSVSESNAFVNFIKGGTGSYMLPYTFTMGNCTRPMLFEFDGSGNITIKDNPPTQPCKKFCFENESECYVEVSIGTECLDDPCTPGIDYIPGSAGPKYLGPGYPTSGCLDFGFSSETGCPLCPCDDSEIYFNFCGNHDCVPPCTNVSLSDIKDGGAIARICCNGTHPVDLVITIDASGVIHIH